MTPILTQAGPYKVNWVPCPFSRKRVQLDLPRAGILHTTEGGFEGSLEVFEQHYAPHFEVGLDKGVPRINQLVKVGYIGSACRAHNDKAIVQIEMVGFSQTTPWYPHGKVTRDDGQVFDYGDTDIALAWLMIEIEKEYGVPLSNPFADDDWPRAGHNPHRNANKFGKIAGWYGHGDMPDPDVHWDPGHFLYSVLFKKCQEIKDGSTESVK